MFPRPTCSRSCEGARGADEPTGNLDSTTGEEIIELLGSLSAQRRQTIVVITHDTAIAARAQRQLRMHDGELLAVDDVPVAFLGTS